MGLEGHCFRVTAEVMGELGNLGVDCLLGGDVIDHMGGVTVRKGAELEVRGSVEEYPVGQVLWDIWYKECRHQ